MRRVFFSFHYENDIARVDQIRKAWITRRGPSQPPFEDGSLWEKVATRDDTLLRRMIDKALGETSVTIVLVGAETANRRYVQYEIEQSLWRGHGLLAVHIHGLPDAGGRLSRRGCNPLDKLTLPGSRAPLSSVYDSYDWVEDQGERNLGRWVEAAAQKRLLVARTGSRYSRAQAAGLPTRTLDIC